MTNTPTERATAESAHHHQPNQPKQTIYSLTWVYRVDPAFHHLPVSDQHSRKAAFLTALAARDASVTLRGVYSLVGLRAQADLMLWVWGPDLDALQRLAVALRQSGLGRIGYYSGPMKLFRFLSRLF